MTYEHQKARCLEEGVLFEDPEFPAVNKSLFFSSERSTDTILWKRPGEIHADPRFVTDGASRHDLHQGRLGDCWFLCAAANLAMFPHLYQRVVPPGQTFQQQYAGIFRFVFWRFGEWREVIVDDRLPCKNDRLYFCRNDEEPNEFWGPLLEKAYAKVCGSYEALEGGYSHEALVDFTGGVGEFLNLQRLEGEPDPRVFAYLLRVHNRNSFICATIDAMEGEEAEVTRECGLVTGHAYSVSGVVQFPLGEGVAANLLRLRNPWGKREWNGAWSDESDEWQQLSNEKKIELGLEVANEGEFWMTFQDVVLNFDSIQICHLTPDTVHGGGGQREWNITEHHGSWVEGVTAGGCGADPHQEEYWLNPQYFLRLESSDSDGDDGENCLLVVSLMQKYSRVRKTQLATTDTDAAIGFDLYKYRGRDVVALDSQMQVDQSALRVERKMYRYEYLRERSFRFRLEPGTYCIIPACYSVGREGEFLLRLATAQPAQSGIVEETSIPSGSDAAEETFSISQVQSLFTEYSGDDEVVDAGELRRILNQGLVTERRNRLTKATCRALIQSIMGSSRGLLDFEDCKRAWRKVRSLKQTFSEFDRNESGDLGASELRRAFKSMGHTLSKDVLASIVQRYCGKSNNLSLDDFVLCAVKVTTASETFENAQRRGGARSTNHMQVSMDELLCLTL